MRQNVLKKIMGPSQKSEEHSFFGGPLSTRETCRAAVRKQQGVEDASQGDTPPPQRAAKKGDAIRKLKMLSKKEETVERPHVKNLPPVKERSLGSAPPQSRQTLIAGKEVVDRLQKMRMTKRAKLRRRLGLEEGVKRISPSRDGPVRKKVQMVQRTTGIKRKQERNVEDGLQQRRRSFTKDPLESRQRLPPSRQGPVVIRRKPVAVIPEDLNDFIVDGDDEDGQAEVDWHAELRKCTKYDPSKFRDNYDLDDRCMESSLRQCWKEERRSQFIGRMEDQREFERERSRRTHRS